MPFSRRPARRAFSSRSRFRKRGLRVNQDLRRWEAGNFDVTQTYAAPVPNATYTPQATPLAQVSDHLADTATVAGALEAYKIRAIEVGGLVFCTNTFLNQAPVAAVSAHAKVWHMLYIDRLGAGGAPVNLPDFSKTTAPVLSAGAASTFETAFPTRIIWREQRVIPIGANDVGVPHPQTYYSGSRSLRLRCRLLDDWGLFFYSAIFFSTGGAALTFTTLFSGSIYWRTSYK